MKEPIPNNISVLAFDWDNTLVDSRAKLAQNLDIAHHFGNTAMTLDDVRVHWNESAGFADLMARLTSGTDMAEVMDYVTPRYDLPEYAKQSFAFTIPALGRAAEQGYQLAIVSNVADNLLKKDAESLGISLDEFSFVQTSDDGKTVHKKPDPRVFNPLLRALQVHPGQVLYVGDELKDYYAAHRAGLSFIGVESGMATSDEFTTAGARSVPTIENLI